MPQSLALKLFIHPWYRLSRGMTLGTRVLVIDSENRIPLVRHSYAAGWFLPGGGVERGETIFESAKRELREEAAIIAEEEPRLHGLFLNDRHFAGDHVAVLVVRRFRQEPFKSGMEIQEVRFFEADQLPDGTTGGTRRRIAEVVDGAPLSGHW